MTYTLQCEVIVNDDTLTLDPYYPETMVVQVGFGVYTVLGGLGDYNWIYLDNEAAYGRRVLTGAGGDSGLSYNVGQTYTLKFEIDTAASTLKHYLDSTLLYTVSLFTVSESPVSAILRHHGTTDNVATAWSLDADIDNFLYSANGGTVDSDDFGDGDLTNWPITTGGDFNTGESGGIYWGDDQSDTDYTKTTERTRTLPGIGTYNNMTHNKRTMELHHAYNSSGTIVVQTFEPGAVTPVSTVNVATGKGILSPALEFDDEGKLVCLLSDGTTRYAAANPRLAASWGAWAIP